MTMYAITKHIMMVVVVVTFFPHACDDWGEGGVDESFPVCAFFVCLWFSGDQLERTNSTPLASISPQWLS